MAVRGVASRERSQVCCREIPRGNTASLKLQRVGLSYQTCVLSFKCFLFLLMRYLFKCLFLIVDILLPTITCNIRFWSNVPPKDMKKTCLFVGLKKHEKNWAWRNRKGHGKLQHVIQWGTLFIFNLEFYNIDITSYTLLRINLLGLQRISFLCNVCRDIIWVTSIKLAEGIKCANKWQGP